jgi:hypothetical protein
MLIEDTLPVAAAFVNVGVKEACRLVVVIDHPQTRVNIWPLDDLVGEVSRRIARRRRVE